MKHERDGHVLAVVTSRCAIVLDGTQVGSFRVRNSRRPSGHRETIFEGIYVLDGEQCNFRVEREETLAAQIFNDLRRRALVAAEHVPVAPPDEDHEVVPTGGPGF